MPKVRVSVAIILPDSCLKKCSTTSVTLAAEEAGGVVSESVIVLTDKSPALLLQHRLNVWCHPEA